MHDELQQISLRVSKRLLKRAQALADEMMRDYGVGSRTEIVRRALERGLDVMACEAVARRTKTARVQK